MLLCHIITIIRWWRRSSMCWTRTMSIRMDMSIITTIIRVAIRIMMGMRDVSSSSRCRRLWHSCRRVIRDGIRLRILMETLRSFLLNRQYGWRHRLWSFVPLQTRLTTRAILLIIWLAPRGFVHLQPANFVIFITFIGHTSTVVCPWDSCIPNNFQQNKISKTKNEDIILLHGDADSGSCHGGLWA